MFTREHCIMKWNVHERTANRDSAECFADEGVRLVGSPTPELPGEKSESGPAHGGQGQTDDEAAPQDGQEVAGLRSKGTDTGVLSPEATMCGDRHTGRPETSRFTATSYLG